MPRFDNSEVTLKFRRHNISGLPKSLERLATRQTDDKRRGAILQGAEVIRGWLKSEGDIVHCRRSVKAWRDVLMPWATECGEHTVAKLIELKLEYEAEQVDHDNRTAEAMAQYRAGGGE